MGYNFQSPAAGKIFSSLPPSLGADPAFLAVAKGGAYRVRDWCRNLVLQIETALMNMDFTASDRGRFDIAKELFKARISDACARLTESGPFGFSDQDADAVSQACKELVDSCEELVAMRNQQIKDWGKPYLQPVFDNKVKGLRDHESSVWKACQGIAVIEEAVSTGKPWDALLGEIVAQWEPARPRGPGGGPAGGAHRLPPPPKDPRGGAPTDPPGGGEPSDPVGEPGGVVEPPPEPGRIIE